MADAIPDTNDYEQRFRAESPLMLLRKTTTELLQRIVGLSAFSI